MTETEVASRSRFAGEKLPPKMYFLRFLAGSLSNTRNLGDFDEPEEQEDSDTQQRCSTSVRLSSAIADVYWGKFGQSRFREIIDDLEGSESLVVDGGNFSIDLAFVFGHSCNRIGEFELGREAYAGILKFLKLEAVLKTEDNREVRKHMGATYIHLGISFVMQAFSYKKPEEDKFKIQALTTALDFFVQALDIFEDLKDSWKHSKSHSDVVRRYWNAKISKACCFDEIRHVNGEIVPYIEIEEFLQDEDCPKDRLLLLVSIHYWYRRDYSSMIKTYENVVNWVCFDDLLKKRDFQKALFYVAFAYNRDGQHEVALTLLHRIEDACKQMIESLKLNECNDNDSKQEILRENMQYFRSNVQKQLGWTYNFLREYDKSHEAYQKAVTLNPDDRVSWFRRGILEAFLIPRRNVGDAIESFSMAAKMGHENAWIGKFILQNSIERVDENLSMKLEIALKKDDPVFSEKTKHDIRILLLGTVDIDDLSSDGEENETNPYVSMNHALAYLQSGDMVNASRLSKQGYEFTPSNLLAHAIRKFIDESIEFRHFPFIFLFSVMNSFNILF